MSKELETNPASVSAPAGPHAAASSAPPLQSAERPAEPGSIPPATQAPTDPLAQDAPLVETKYPKSLLLIRHAEVERKYQGVFGGRIDMELSPRGHEQAAALARYLQSHRVEAAYASPMRRVQQTLAPLVASGIPQPTICPDLREVDFGDWTGLAWEEVEARFGISAFAWLDQLECAGIANAECARTLRARVAPCLESILTQSANRQVAVICHGGVIRMALSVLFGFSLPEMACFEIEYASITRIVWVARQPRLDVANFTPWRDLIT